MSLKDDLSKRMKDRTVKCKSISAKIHALCTEIKTLTEHDMDTYKMLTKPDCLYNDCPISHFQTFRYVKEQLTKEGLELIGGPAYDGPAALRTISERAEEIPNWVLRFSNEKKQEPKGIAAII